VKAPWNETYRLRHLKTRTGINFITQKQYDELIKYPIVKES
jgi:hypothetical protein